MFCSLPHLLLPSSSRGGQQGEGEAARLLHYLAEQVQEHLTEDSRPARVASLWTHSQDIRGARHGWWGGEGGGGGHTRPQALR